MASGAFEPHALLLSLHWKLNTEKGTKGIEPDDLNPYCKKEKEVEIKSSAGVSMLMQLIPTPTHGIGRKPLKE